MPPPPFRVRINVEARQTLRRMVDEHEAIQEGLGKRLPRRFVDAIDVIVDRPLSLPVYHLNVRRVRLDPFKVAAFFRVVGDEVRVIGLADLRQDPKRIRRMLE